MFRGDREDDRERDVGGIQEEIYRKGKIMIGTKWKTPRRPKGKHKKKSTFHPANDSFRQAGMHNARHGKMGAREKAAYAKLRKERADGGETKSA